MQTHQLVIDSTVPTRADLSSLEGMEPQLILIFASVEHFTDSPLVALLRECCPHALLVGCSTAGEIGGEGVMEHTAVITAVRFERVEVAVAAAAIDTMEESYDAGVRLGKALARSELRGVLLFGKGVEVNGSALISGVIAEVGVGIPVTGGLAGDNGAFGTTYTLSPEGVSDVGVVAVGLYGEALVLGYGSFGGWSSFGPPRKVTRCEGNVLYELDGNPALQVYKDYLGEYADGLPASGLLFPFEMLREDHSTAGLIRTILGVDEAQGSVTLAGEIDPEGYLRLMHATNDALVEGAEKAAQHTISLLPADTRGGLAILVSCVGRKLVMGDQVDDEVEAVAEVLGKTTTLTGFYSYGEIAPFSTTSECKLHNQTMTVTFLGES
ncbi:FIST signal transduction protein [Endothiovibrio diazotrophicus]